MTRSVCRTCSEFLWNFIRDIARDNIGEKYYRDWLPFIGTLFLFIFVSNWGGALIPWKIFELPRVSSALHRRHQHHRGDGSAGVPGVLLCRPEP